MLSVQQLRHLKTPVLVDLLSAYTSQHTRMLNEGASDKEFASCSLTIKAIHSEIESRRQPPTGTPGARPDSTPLRS